MAKKVITLIFLIISVIMLIYMFLSHYGILRYIKLHRMPLEHYSNNYTKLPKADKQRVVVAFSLENINELNRIKPFLNSILDQTVRVDDIALILPQKYSTKKLADKYNFLSTYFYTMDYRDSSCLITTVLREPETNTKIILVSTNMVYGKEFVQAMVESSNDNVDCIIYAQKNSKDKGILVKPKFFNEKISELDKSKNCLQWIHNCSDAEIKICGYGEIYKKI